MEDAITELEQLHRQGAGVIIHGMASGGFEVILLRAGRKIAATARTIREAAEMAIETSNHEIPSEG